MVTAGWKMECGGWRVESGRWRMVRGWRRVYGGDWATKMDDSDGR